MTTLGFWFVILIWLLPIVLVIIRHRQLQNRRVKYIAGMPIGLGYRVKKGHVDQDGHYQIDEVEPLEASLLGVGPPVSIFQDFSRNKFEDSFDRAANAGESWKFTAPYHPGFCAEGCQDCRGEEFPCFCRCHQGGAA